MSLLPCILDKTDHFLGHLDRYARTGDEFCLDELCINLTFDIIGRILRLWLATADGGCRRLTLVS